MALTRDLILIPGTHQRPPDLERCSRFVRNHLETIAGVSVQRHESAGIPSLVACPAGVDRPDILLCAHLDVIDHPDAGAYQSRIADGRICGPGAGDMKGALAVLIEVFREIHERIPGASLALAVTADEEIGGEHGLGYLVRERGLRCRTAMIPDGGAPDRITIEEKGILHLELGCTGRAAHAARPWLGSNPVEHLMDRLAVLRQQFSAWQEADNRWVPTCAVTRIGTRNLSTNRIPSDAMAQLDIRFPPPHTADSMRGCVQDALGPEVCVSTLISAETTHLAPDPAYAAISEQVLGVPVSQIRDDGGSDARFLCALGIPVLMSRPQVGNLHAEDEWVDIGSLLAFYRIYLSYLVQRLTSRS